MFEASGGSSMVEEMVAVIVFNGLAATGESEQLEELNGVSEAEEAEETDSLVGTIREDPTPAEGELEHVLLEELDGAERVALFDTVREDVTLAERDSAKVIVEELDGLLVAEAKGLDVAVTVADNGTL